jgi:succinate-acetate transporter protein
MNLVKEFDKLCDPAKLYLLLSFSSILLYIVHLVKQGSLPKVTELSMQVLVLVVWTVILNKVCSFKYGVKISWVLVALPIVFMILAIVFAVYFIDELDLSKADLKDLMNQTKQLKNNDDDDGLEGFQGCGNAN